MAHGDFLKMIYTIENIYKNYAAPNNESYAINGILA